VSIPIVCFDQQSIVVANYTLNETNAAWYSNDTTNMVDGYYIMQISDSGQTPSPASKEFSLTLLLAYAPTS